MGHSVAAGTRRARGGMHYKPRRCSQLQQEHEARQAERDAQRAARDAEYRAALRVGIGEKLPAVLGNVQGHGRAAGAREARGHTPWLGVSVPDQRAGA